ncbi:MAG: signal peptidase I [Acetivibrio ethanolgignens]
MKLMKNYLKKASLILAVFFFIYGVASFLNDYLLQAEKIQGTSMEPLLTDGEMVFVSDIPFWFSKPKRFDVIAFKKENTLYVKRIVGLPGEKIAVKNGNIYIDGQVVPENFGKETISEDMEEMVLRKEEYFVLGDNRNFSIDSRSREIGAVKKEQIRGKVLFK